MVQFFCVVAALIGAGCVVMAWLPWRKAGLISSKETRSIASVKGGFVEVKGTVVPLTTLESPLTGAPCVFYKYKIEEWVAGSSSGFGRRRSGGGHWRTVRKGAAQVAFLLDDGTGRARIEPEGAEFEVDADGHARSGTFNDPTPDLQRFLNREGVAATGFFGFNKSIRVNESSLAVGEALYVLGAARPAGRTGAGGETIVIARHDDAPAFLISDKPEDRLVSSLRGRAALYAGGGTLLAVAAFLFGLYGPRG